MKSNCFHRAASALLTFAALVTTLPAATLVNSFTDIQYWVGTGTQSAALVIDWNNAGVATSFAWGYHWNGAATGEDMLEAIAGFVGTDQVAPVADGTGDKSLTLLTQFFSSVGSNSVYQLSYSVDSATQSHTGFDPDTNSYWAYYVANNTTSLPTWTYSLTEGFAARALADKSWDGWSWSDGSDGTEPSQPFAAAVPEPATVALLGLSALALVLRRRRHA